MQKIHVHGYNGDVDTGAAEDVWTTGGLYPFPTVAAATTIVSGSASDTAAGTGARTVRVIGLDANYLQIQEDIVLNGATPVTLVNTYLRILRASIQTIGSGGTNAGLISIKQSSTVLCDIVAAQGHSEMAIYTASSNLGNANWQIKKILIAAVNAVAGSVTVRLWTRKTGGAWHVRWMSSVYGTSKSSDSFEFSTPIPLSSGEDARLEATTSTDNTAVAASLEIQAGSVSELA